MPAKVLIVDDDADIREFLADQIRESIHAEISDFGRAQDALSACNETKFDIMVLDYRMPDMSGYDLAIKLRQAGQLNQHTPILFCSGFTTGLADQLMQQQIANCKVLKKPIDIDELDQYLRQLSKAQAS